MLHFKSQCAIQICIRSWRGGFMVNKLPCLPDGTSSQHQRWMTPNSL